MSYIHEHDTFFPVKTSPAPFRHKHRSIFQLEIAICDLVMALVEGSNDEAKLEHVLDQIKPTLRHFFETNHLWVSQDLDVCMWAGGRLFLGREGMSTHGGKASQQPTANNDFFKINIFVVGI